MQGMAIKGQLPGSLSAAAFETIQLQLRHAKETEGRRMKSERLRQKNVLRFAEKSIRCMAIAHVVSLGCVAIAVIAVLKA